MFFLMDLIDKNGNNATEELNKRAKFLSENILEYPLQIPVYYFEPEGECDAAYITRGFFRATNDYGLIEDDIKIGINVKFINEPILLNSILLHELLHYKLWSIGLDYHDNSIEFSKRAKEIGVCNNFEYNYENKKENEKYYKTTFGDMNKLKKYEKMYNEHVKK